MIGTDVMMTIRVCSDEAEKTRRKVVSCLRILAGLGLLAALGHFGVIDFGGLGIIVSQTGSFVGAIAALSLAVVLNAFRWRLFLQALGHDVTPVRAYGVLAASGLVGTLLPGLIATDGVRAAMARSYGIQLRCAVASTVIDRLAGATLTLAIGLVLMLVKPDILTEDFDRMSALLAVLGVVATGTTGVLAVRASQRWMVCLEPAGHVLRWLLAFVVGALDDFAIVARRPGILIFAVMITTAIWICNVAAIFVIVVSFSAEAASLINTAIAFTTAMIASTLSITPSGIGVGEAVFAHVIESAGDSIAGVGVAFLIWRIARLASLLPGLIFLVVNQSRL